MNKKTPWAEKLGLKSSKDSSITLTHQQIHAVSDLNDFKEYIIKKINGTLDCLHEFSRAYDIIEKCQKKVHEQIQSIICNIDDLSLKHQEKIKSLSYEYQQDIDALIKCYKNEKQKNITLNKQYVSEINQIKSAYTNMHKSYTQAQKEQQLNFSNHQAALKKIIQLEQKISRSNKTLPNKKEDDIRIPEAKNPAPPKENGQDFSF